MFLEKNIKNVKKCKESLNKIGPYEEIAITNKTINNLDFIKAENGKKIMLCLVSPAEDYKNYEEIVPYIKDVIEKILEVVRKNENIKINGIPWCFFEEESRKFVIDFEPEPKSFDVEEITSYFINNMKVKSRRCISCIYNKKCKGVYLKYIMKYGFKELRPILK